MGRSVLRPYVFLTRVFTVSVHCAQV